jgi:hypothetical protein
MNKLESINEGGQNLATKVVQVDQLDVIEDSTIRATRNIHELNSLQGKLAYIRRFITNLAGRCQPFTYLMKKDTSFY